LEDWLMQGRLGGTYVVAALALLAATGAAHGQVRDTTRLGEQADTIRLREIVVTAARVPVPIAEAPGSITVLAGADLRERGIRYAAEALRLVPGAAVVQGAGPGALASVFMRGGQSDYVQVLVDGVQVNDPGGAFDWAHLRVDDIARIEVVRGPASVLYGSDAVSGVVQIFTRSGGTPRIGVTVTSSAGDRQGPDPTGTYRTHAADASLTGSSALHGAVLRYGVNVGRHASNGLYTLNSSYDNTTASGRLQLAVPRADASVTARIAGNGFHYPTDGSGAVVDPNQFSTGEARSVGFDAGYRLLQPLELRVLATSHANDVRIEDPANFEGDGEFWSTSAVSRRKLDARLNAYVLRGAVLTAGAERQWQALATQFESISEWGTWEDETDESRTNTGWYAQLHTGARAGVAGTFGVRIDRNDRFGTFRTGRAALSWSPAAATRVHAAWGTAFREPTFFQNYAAGFATGNPELQPEQTRSWEAGAQASPAGGLVLGATWFDQRFRNLIQYTAAPPEPGAPNYFNVGAARARGAELSARGELGRVALAAAYTRTDTHVTDDGFGTDGAFLAGGRLLRRPLDQASASLSVAASAVLRLLADVRYTGRREDLDFTTAWAGARVTLPSYMTLDLGAEYAVLRRDGSTVDLTLRLRNALDERYHEIHNFPAPGRVLQLGVRAGMGL
jgi:vitamin B12 transporter